jgi:hypothetical protein
MKKILVIISMVVMLFGNQPKLEAASTGDVVLGVVGGLILGDIILDNYDDTKIVYYYEEPKKVYYKPIKERVYYIPEESYYYKKLNNHYHYKHHYKKRIHKYRELREYNYSYYDDTKRVYYYGR